MQLNLLRYFVALAREEHFARAAASCNITQPTLSAGIAALEAQLGKRLVTRDRRYIGLTAEGLAALPWAQQILAALEGLGQSVAGVRGAVTGELRLGAIPASMPVVGVLARAIRHRTPGLTLSVRSLTSRAIDQGLSGFELDAGITYLDHESPGDVVSVPLYAECYRAAIPADAEPAGDTIAWDAMRAVPLCLLHQGMQNRRILDQHLAARGIALSPVATADSYVALMAMVATGAFVSIVPDSYGATINRETVRLLRFDDPLPPNRIGLVVRERVPLGPLSAAALSIATAVAASGDCHSLSTIDNTDLTAAPTADVA